MATTCFFEEKLKDKERDDRLDFEFGKTSWYGENLMYIRVGDTAVALDKAKGREVYEAMRSLGAYLGYEA